VQVALLTKRIEELGDHFKSNSKDFSSRHGLLRMVGRRKRLLKYLMGKNYERYTKLIKSLGLRK
jgi:small subunit ribosomal protein S15